ncbi:MAG: radical SAM protein [Candidatus Omnitrophica bacterium]|nr:radical SAM protein [Candidatus Omnitrophota bacterium]MCK5287418.1 radical SAM protein [Candidatus Omnitrophota bacterium]
MNNVRNIYNLGIRVLVNKVLRVKTLPIALNWAITYRCNQDCLYCNLKSFPQKELSTIEILSALDRLKTLKISTLFFTGGEPLIREDIEEIIYHAKKINHCVYLNTNGSITPSLSSEIFSVDKIFLSYEGSENIHDSIRGVGSYKKLLIFLNKAIQKNKKVLLLSTINKANVDFMEDILKFGEFYKIPIRFQPLSLTSLGAKQINPLLPDIEKYRKALNYLIDVKKKKICTIYNSLDTLEYYQSWPNQKKILCTAGNLFFRVEPDGKILCCPKDRNFTGTYLSSPDLKEVFKKSSSQKCNECWCASITELNWVMKLRWKSIWNLFVLEGFRKYG